MGNSHPGSIQFSLVIFCNTEQMTDNKSRAASWDDDSNNSTHSSLRRSVDEYGWFEDFESPSRDNERNKSINSNNNNMNYKLSIKELLRIRPPLSDIPQCILESSLLTQVLWYNTAGQRPKQPKEEREYFERLWSENFEKSDALKHYNNQISGYESLDPCDVNGKIIYQGNVPFSNSVSKSFMGNDISNMTIQIPTFRIIKADHSVYAEFLIIIGINGISFGLWRRHSNFQQLAGNLQFNDDNNSQYKNAILSWKCVEHRKRWYKSLDSEYLAIKCFLFERFLHDILFESHSPLLIINFLNL